MNNPTLEALRDYAREKEYFVRIGLVGLKGEIGVQIANLPEAGTWCLGTDLEEAKKKLDEWAVKIK